MGLVESKGPVVLIVEDEFLLRMDAVDMIAAAGFEAVEAANADQAIKFLKPAGKSPWFSPISRCQARWTD
jgi:CheY-like chemotaxis protein